MSGFIIVAALLVLGALFLLVPPLFGAGIRRMENEDVGAYQARTALAVLREQLADLEAEHQGGQIAEADYLRAREELERRALDEGEAKSAALALKPARAWGIALMLAVPAVAALIYVETGEPGGLDPARVAAAPAGNGQITQAQIEEMVSGLVKRLEENPDDPEGWFMLARSYTVMERFGPAAEAYARLAKLVPDESQVYADWADALAAANGRNLVGEPEPLIAKALELDPNNVKALALSGSVAFQKSDYARASSEWERILPLLPPQDEMAQSIRQGINEARARGKLPPLAMPAPAAAGGAGVSLSGALSLSPELAAQAAPDDTVFIFVRPIEGGMPFAILRHTVSELPLQFDFTGVPSMAGNRPIPAQVAIGARISKSGTASAGAGDLETGLLTVAPDASALQLVIDRTRDASASAAPAPSPMADAPPPAAGPGLTLSGVVALSAELKDQAAPEDTVFIFVRPAEGGMPFAVLRNTVSSLPSAFDFTGVPAMAGDRPIPAQVAVVARVSKSGDAIARPGDLETAPLLVGPDATGISLVVDRPAGSPRAAAPAPAASTGSGITLAGELSLAPELAAKATPDDVVFIFVGPVGGGMPFAILRHTVSELPLRFDFDGVPAMAGNRPIPAEVAIGARISKSGTARATAGDLESPALTVQPDTTGVKLVLDHERSS
jgi:cytochrome c-type biogenesis protein CcmH